MEQQREDKTPEQVGKSESAVQLLFRGGLKGRFSTEFCTLQSAVDALECYVSTLDTAAKREQARELVEEMNRSIVRLERLAENTADLALCGRVPELEPLAGEEMFHYLKEFCECANGELALRGAPGRVRLADPAVQPMWLKTSRTAMDALLSNLVSNSLSADIGAQIILTLTPDHCLAYCDGTLWPEDACGVLLGEQPSPELASNGSTGLLLVRRYAEVLSWKIESCAAQEGQTVLQFRLPCGLSDEEGLEFLSKQNQEVSRSSRLRMELDAVLPGTKISSDTTS